MILGRRMWSGERGQGGVPTPPTGHIPLTTVLFSRRSAFCLRQGGFTLIEGMVALIVLSIGLFGIAGMLDMAISRNTDGSQVSVATNMGTEMMERIRFNHYNAAAYDLIDTTNLSTRPPATQAMAMGDYDQWRARLNATNLQNIRGMVTVGNTGPTLMNQSQVVVQVSWRGGLRTQTLLVSTIFAPE